MGFTIFSFLTSLIWISLFAMIVTFLRKRMDFLKYFSIYPLLLILFISFIRLFLPFELPYTKVVPSVTFLPALQQALCYPLIKLSNGKAVITPSTVLAFIWVIIAIKQLFIKMRECFYLCHLLHFLPVCEDRRLQNILSNVQDMMHLKKHVKIIVNKEIRSPAISGFFSPFIMLPDLSFTDDELFGIFTHEWSHYRYRHAIIKVIGEIIQCVFWWNPIFKRLNKEIAYALEMHSDQMVDKLLNKNQQHSYLNAIIRVTNNLSGNEKSSALACSLIEKRDDNMLRQRFEMMLKNNYSDRKKAKILLLIFPICIVFTLSYSFVIQPHSLPDISQCGEIQNIPDNAYIVTTDTGYILYNSDGKFIADITFIDNSIKHLKILD